MVTMTWTTLRADGLNLPFSSEKGVSMFTSTSFDLDRRTAESVVNFAGIDIMTIVYREDVGGDGGGEGALIDERIAVFLYLVDLLATFASSMSDTR